MGFNRDNNSTRYFFFYRCRHTCTYSVIESAQDKKGVDLDEKESDQKELGLSFSSSFFFSLIIRIFRRERKTHETQKKMWTKIYNLRSEFKTASRLIH